MVENGPTSPEFVVFDILDIIGQKENMGSKRKIRRTHQGRSQRRRSNGGGAWLGGADGDELGLRHACELRAEAVVH